jgi:bacteriorhodopsin
MNNKNAFYATLILSVIVQILTGALEIGTLFIKVDSPYLILRQLLVLELMVQMIEGLFYVWLVYNFNQVINVTPKRYIDWSITTPTMLITLIIYLIYLKNKEENKDTSKLELFDLLSKNSKQISYVIYLNLLMLIFGYLGEMKIISTLSGVMLGFIPFLIYYYIIYVNYANQSKNGWKIFLYFFFFWSLYGFVALLPYYIKNTLYNILDLFAKNFFGVFLSYIIITKNY